MKKNAFTLIELLVLIAILAIVTALIVPAITRAHKGENKTLESAYVYGNITTNFQREQYSPDQIEKEKSSITKIDLNNESFSCYMVMAKVTINSNSYIVVSTTGGVAICPETK